MQGPLHALSQEVLRTDVAGMPLEWIDYRVAATLYHSGQVAYACGSLLYRIRGGYCAKSGQRSIIEVNSIVATHGDTHTLERNRERYTPPLNNRTLFKRDANLCMYCGLQFRAGELTRDHITPISRGGRDVWTNVVTACRRCNNHKGGRTPEEERVHAHLKKLLALRRELTPLRRGQLVQLKSRDTTAAFA